MGTAAETIHVNADTGQVFARVTSEKPKRLPPAVTIGALQLSDLFFNHENQNYAKACVQDRSNKDLYDRSNEDLYAALADDAKGFCAMIGVNEEYVEAFVENFMNRL